MRSAFEIVPYFLRQSEKNPKSLITPLKLQKLLYYAQAWSLVFRGKILFYEDIEAWIHGPAIPPVYRRYKQYGYSTLNQENLFSELKVDEIDILNMVWMSYGKKSAKSLEELTHSEYPWIKTRAGLRVDQPSNKKISIRDMRSYYLQFVESELPPKISFVALQKKKETHKRHSINNILIGIGSVLDIYPVSSHHSSYVPNDFATSLSDFESISSDWEKVGGYIQGVMDVVQEKSSTEYEQTASKRTGL